MKRSLPLLIFILACLCSFAQIKSQINNGHLLLKPIKATTYTFPERIYGFEIDSTRKQAHILMRKMSEDSTSYADEGSTLILNLQTDQVVWKSPNTFNYKDDQNWMYEDKLISVRNKQTSCIDLRSGKTDWKRTRGATVFLKKANLVLEYDTRSDYVEAYHPQDGRTIWAQEIPKKNTWSYYNIINDTSLLVSSNGIQLINIRNGKYWIYQAKSNGQDYSTELETSIISMSMGISFGLIGVAFTLPLTMNKVHDLSALPLILKDRIIYADTKLITCHSMDGNIIWSTDLISELSSHSRILQRNDTLFLINMGYGIKQDKPVAYGSPYIAAYNINTGQYLYIKKFKEKNLLIRQLSMGPNYLHLVFNRQLVSLNLNNRLSTTRSNLYNTARLTSQDTSYYLKSDKLFECVNNNKDHIYLWQDDKLVELNELLVKINEWPAKQLYAQYLKTEKFIFVGNNTETFVLNHASQAIAQVLASRNALLIGHKLFDAQQKSLVVSDLSEL